MPISEVAPAPWALHLVVLDPAPQARAAHYDAWCAQGATVTLVPSWDDLRRVLTTQKASVVAVPWHARAAPALAAWVAVALPAYRGRLAWWPAPGAPPPDDPPADPWWAIPLAAHRPAADSIAALDAWMQRRSPRPADRAPDLPPAPGV